VIILQNKIKYQGDISQSPFSKIRLAVHFPVFDYVRSNVPMVADARSNVPVVDDVRSNVPVVDYTRSNVSVVVYAQSNVPVVADDRSNAANFEVDRIIVSTDRLEVDHELSSETYRISAPTSDLIGDNKEAISNFLIFTTKAVGAKNISDLSLTIPVQIVAGSAVVGAGTLQAVYIIKHVHRHFDAATTSLRTYIGPEPEAASFLERSIFLINKDTYAKILPSFRNITNRNDDWSLLSVISKFVEEADIDPTAPMELNDASRVLLERVLQTEHIERPDEVVRFIGKFFKDLFDFPILIPAIETLEIAGVFEVKTPDSTRITKDDLLFYDLTFEYSHRGADNLVMSKIVHYDWNRNNNPVNENKIPFSLTGTAQIIISSVSGPITISVRAFDGTSLWVKDYELDDPALKEVMIVVSQLRPATLKPAGPNRAADTGKKLRGQVLELTKKCALKDLIVVIQAKEEGDELWRVVAAASTDASGNFSMPYPYGEYAKAQAIVSLTPDRPADITIKDLGNKNETISDDFLYLLITNPECPELSKEEDCDCNAPKRAPRLPDQRDLIYSDDYTQDIGGSCLNLSTPNRTLNEFSYCGIVRTSDPHVANYTLNKIKLNNDIHDYTFRSELKGDRFKFELKCDQKIIQRAAVDIDNPIRWQDAPGFGENLTIYQSVSVATGHVLHYKSVFKADGYSLGNLLYSLALAPGQKKQIVVIDSAHSIQAAESQNIVQGESLAVSLLNERSITDQLGGNINEAMRGSSSASTGGISAGLGLAANLGVVSGALGVAGGYSSGTGSASQNSSRDTSMFFGERLRQSIMQNAESYRQLNATVITAVKEGQQYAVTTDVVANHNHCHALTMMYFEVLRHFAIFQEMVNVEECIFVPLLMTNFSTENIYKWSDVLARNLLPMSSNTYLQPFSWVRQHPLLKAFDANERIKTNYANVDFPAGRYCDESISSISGTVTIRANIPRPKTRFDRLLSLPITRKTETTPGGVDVQGTVRDNIKSSVVGALTGGLSLLLGGGQSVKYTQESHEVLTKEKIFDLFMTLDENYESVPPAQCIRVHNFKKIDTTAGTPIDFFGSQPDDKKLWEAYAAVLDGMDVYELLNKFSGNVISDWDQIFYDNIAPLIIKKLINEGAILPAPLANLDLTNTNKYSGNEQVLKYNFTASTTKTRADILHVDISYNWNFGIGLPERTTLIDNLTLNVENLTINYSTTHYHGRIFSGYVGNDLLDNIMPTVVVNIPTPLNFDEKRNPRLEDIYIVNKLIEHLNSNLEHYNKTLWYNLDPDRRFMLLDGFNIQIYNDFGVPAGTRSLASVVKNELLTVTGNSLVFPVAAGYKVSQSYISEKNQDGDTVDVSLFDHYKPYTPIPPYRISVPSRGVFLEAVQGQCDACERVKENSSQDWTKFKADEPTPVLPVQTPVPTITDWKAAFKDFAPPLINIQNAPALPAPGAGLTGLIELLGKTGIFKDITGLDATQQNVIRTYLSNQENAKAFAEMAKGMAMQDHNTQHSDKIMDSLKTAKDSGAINQDEYGKLVKDHLQKQIDGGEAQNQQAAQQNKKLETSPIKSAVELAQAGNKDVSATESDSQGNTKTLEVKSKGDINLKYNFSVPGTIGVIKQQSANACWATVTTMMSNWKKQSSQTVDDYIKGIGAEYVPFIQTGITISKLSDFCDSTGLKAVYTNTEYPVSFYYDVLQKNGPIWVIDLESDNPKLLHGRLLIGIRGDDSSATTMFTIIDPATGSKYDEDLPTFVSKTENVVRTLDAIKDVQIPLLIYYKESYDKSSFVGNPQGGAFVGTGADNQTRVRTFVPVNENALIVDGREENAVPNLTNWRGLYKNADGSFSQTKMSADRNFNYPPLPATPVGTKYCAGSYRGVTAINKLVLHETADFNNYTSVSQFNVLPFPNAQHPTSWYKAMPHFCINTDGSIIQFLDVCEHAEHGEGLSSSSIGIEFVNHPWGQEGFSQDGSVKGGITPFRIPALPGYPSLNNKNVTTCLYIPAEAQLESLVNLLNALFAVSSLSFIKQNWLNEININPAKFATEKLDDLRAYFILNNANIYLKNPKFSGINGNASSDGWSANTAGVFDHALFGGHTDGMIQSFYTWLRIGQKINQGDAMVTFKSFIADKNSRQIGGNNVILVDVSKIVFAVA